MIQQLPALDRFTPRPYQIPVLKAMLKDNVKRALLCWPRRAGKDLTAYTIMYHKALEKPGVYYYVFPTFSQGRRILWDSITNDGFRILDYIPEFYVESRHEQQMRIKLINGSIIQIIGSDSYDKTLIGTNPQGMIFSEYALQDPQAYALSRPILAANRGWALFVSTPRGHNHFWELYKVAEANPQLWHTEKLTVDDTKHITPEQIQEERVLGEMSEDLIQQEYYTSFSLGIQGSYYTRYIDTMRLEGRITKVSWDPTALVHSFWDIGVRDSTIILMAQIIGRNIYIIDTYENSKEGLEHYTKLLKEKPYQWGTHIAPHDIKVQEFGSGITRIEKARELGIDFVVAPDVKIVDGIEAVRTILPRLWINETCTQLIKALENYRQEFDDKHKVYKPNPLHNWASHWADAMRYLAVSLPKTSDSLTPEALDKRYYEAVYGSDMHHMPGIFQDGHGTNRI